MKFKKAQRSFRLMRMTLSAKSTHQNRNKNSYQKSPNQLKISLLKTENLILSRTVKMFSKGLKHITDMKPLMKKRVNRPILLKERKALKRHFPLIKGRSNSSLQKSPLLGDKTRLRIEAFRVSSPYRPNIQMNPQRKTTISKVAQTRIISKTLASLSSISTYSKQMPSKTSNSSTLSTFKTIW